jgi:hypothetical protein
LKNKKEKIVIKRKNNGLKEKNLYFNKQILEKKKFNMQIIKIKGSLENNTQFKNRNKHYRIKF